jgi:hypothetical protein
VEKKSVDVEVFEKLQNCGRGLLITYHRYILGVVVGVMVPKRNAEVVEELQNRGGWRREMPEG